MGLASNTVNSVKSQASGLNQWVTGMHELPYSCLTTVISLFCRTSSTQDYPVTTTTAANYENSDWEEQSPPSSK